MKVIRNLCLMVMPVLLAAVGFASDTKVDLASGKMDDVLKALNTQVATDTRNAEAFHMLNKAYYSIEDWDSAIKSGEKAVSLKPNDAGFHYWLGKAYGEKADRVGAFKAMGLAKKTVAEFEKAVQLNPKDRKANMALAEFYVEAPGIMGGGKDKARKLADQIAPADPAVAAWIRALTANKEKKYPEAEAEFKEAVRASGGAAWAYLELARYFGWGKRWNEFEGAVRSAVDSQKKTPADVFNAADLLIGRGRNFEGAAQILKNYLASPKKDEDGPAFRAHFLLGQVYEKQGNKQGAVEQYRSALAIAQEFRPAQEALKRLGA